MGAVRRALPLILWAAALVLGTALFHALGSGALAAPPLDPRDWNSWAQGKDPLVATVAVLRLVVLALSWYLVGAITIGVVARLLRAARLVRFADALTVPLLRRLLQGALGLSLATAMVTAAVPGGVVGPSRQGTASTATADTATVTLRAEGSPGTVSLGSRPGSATLRGVADGASPQGGTPPQSTDSEVTLGHTGRDRPLPLQLTDEQGQPTDDRRSASDDQPSVPDEPSASNDGSNTHDVVSGDSLWSIAKATLAAAWGRAPSDAEVTGYWRELIEANRGALDDPDNPDMIFPGQRFRLPPTPGA